MSEIKKITDALHAFRDERDWAQFHNPKDLAIAISIEASELLEVYLWKDADKADVNKVKDELADIFAFAFQLAAHYDLEISQIISEKMEKNRLKYPVEKAKGTAKKYTEL
jgi:NTP pyrophosphatase (non-canonical NTP hydrolase)